LPERFPRISRRGRIRRRRVGGDSECPVSLRCLSGRRVRGGNSRVEAVKDLDQIGGTQREADVLDILPNDLCGVDADNLAIAVEQRPTTVAGINGSIRLDPCPAAGIRRSADRANNALCYREWHPRAWIADCNNSLTLADGCQASERQMLEAGAIDFY